MGWGFCWGDESMPQEPHCVVVMFARLCKYAENHGTVCFERENVMQCEFIPVKNKPKVFKMQIMRLPRPGKPGLFAEVLPMDTARPVPPPQ